VNRIRAHDEPLRLERLDFLEASREEWTRLAEASGNVFLTWEWIATWWKHFGAGRPHLAMVCREAAGRVVAILPLVVAKRGPLKVVRFMGHGPADELGPVCASEDRPRAARAMSGALAEADGDLFLGEQLPGNSDWSGWAGGKTVRWEASPVIHSTGRGWEGYLSSKSANFREQVRARERRLLRRHELTYRLASDPGRLQADLDVLFSLHHARWRGRASAFQWEAFHREFASAALERGWLRLWFLELDGRPAAAWYGFRFSDVEAFYQSGRDPRWERASLGFVLLAHSIREALDDGIREYRLLRGDEPYKYRFAGTDPGVITVAVGRGALGSAAVTAGTARYRLARLRRRGLLMARNRARS
jgi:CelD/BcsL family acetyltransferase involved in cellulose biosynthesis